MESGLARHGAMALVVPGAGQGLLEAARTQVRHAGLDAYFD
jgi:hypothetical protein